MKITAIKRKVKCGAICLASAVLVGCAGFAERQNDLVAQYLSTNKGVDPAVREYILKGKVIKGMNAEQALIASGERARGFKNYSIWIVSGGDTLQLPPTVILPGTPTAMILKNTTQYNTIEPQYFVVYMDSNEKVLRIERGTANITDLKIMTK